MVPDEPLLKAIMAQQRIRALFVVPSVIEQLLNESQGIDYFRSLDFVAYRGAPCSQTVGDRVSSVVTLVSPFGSTEAIVLPELSLPNEDWAWHEFNPCFKLEMRPHDSTNNTHELVILANNSTKDITAI
jgi:hypothetical protein